jgi:hypothetical protein
MRLEEGFVRLPMDEFLDAANSADQQEAEHFLVVVVAGVVLSWKWEQRRAQIAGCTARPLKSRAPGGCQRRRRGSAIAATLHTSCRAGWWISSGPPIGVGVAARPLSAPQ